MTVRTSASFTRYTIWSISDKAQAQPHIGQGLPTTCFPKGGILDDSSKAVCCSSCTFMIRSEINPQLSSFISISSQTSRHHLYIQILSKHIYLQKPEKYYKTQ